MSHGNKLQEEIDKLKKQIEESMKLMAFPKIFIPENTNMDGKASIIKLKLKQSDKFIMWVKFQWFKFTRPKEHKKIVELVENMHKTMQNPKNCGVDEE